MASLQEIRAKLLAASNQNSATGNSGDNTIFAHWNIAEGTTTTLRFLPDGDPDNTYFWIERAMIKLPFAGVKGEANPKETIVQVPCMEMWGETCPILTEVRPWFKDKSLEEMGKKYWKKRSYLFQGFVTDSKPQEDNTPENPIRRFILSTQLFNLVKNAVMDNEIEELPTDYVRGLDFKIAKTTKGKYADYSTSTWSRRERALNDEERGAIDQYGLFDLKTFLPKKPGPDEIKAITEMFEASVAGEEYDAERWGKYYKPNGSYNKSDDDTFETGTARVKPAVAPDETSVAAPTSNGAEASDRAKDILQMIRNRQKQ